MSKTQFELTDDVMYVKGVGPARAKLLAKLNIATKYDLLTHYPRAYENHSSLTKISDLLEGETALVVGRVYDVSSRKARNLTIINATLEDETGELQLTWFNQDYLLQKLRRGVRVLVIGKTKIDSWSGEIAMNVQRVTFLDTGEEPELGIMPIYPSTAAITQNVLRTAIKNLLTSMPPLKEILPQKILDEHKLISLDRASRMIHFPKDYVELDIARRRLAFDELFMIQCGLMLIKRQTQDERLGISHAKNGRLVNEVLNELPFMLTDDQRRVFLEVSADMESKIPMRRLIQGDVGAGKTVVALLALVKAVDSGWQGAFMAPTEILAAQHFETFTRLLDGLGIRVGLLSAKVTRSAKMREEIYEKISAHEFDIVVGTHALLQEG